MNFFEAFYECSLPSTVSKNTIKMIGHHSRLRDVTGQSYPIYACARANHARYSSVHVTFCGSSIKVILGNNLGLILSSLINQYCVPKAAFLFYAGNSDNTWVAIVKPTVALLIQLSDKDSTAK